MVNKVKLCNNVRNLKNQLKLSVMLSMFTECNVTSIFYYFSIQLLSGWCILQCNSYFKKNLFQVVTFSVFVFFLFTKFGFDTLDMLIKCRLNNNSDREVHKRFTITDMLCHHISSLIVVMILIRLLVSEVGFF